LTTYTIDHTDPARIGSLYYQVNDYKTISKVAALEKAGGDFSKVKLCYLDSDWEKYGIISEPSESWDELLKIRAWELREKYQYVTLLYSGGWDSHTVLMTFIDNNIKLDEIIVWNKSSWYDDGEFSDAYKLAKKLIEEKNLCTKLTMYEIPWDHHSNVFSLVKDKYIYLPGCQLAFNQTSRIVQHELLPNFLELKNKHSAGSAVFIEAHDKPKVNLRDGKWYYFYVDSTLYSFFGKGASEMFYFSADTLKLQLKQAYMSVRYFEQKLRTTPNATPQLVHDIQGFKNPRLFAEWNLHIGRVCMENASAIYGGLKGNADTTKLVEAKRLAEFTKIYDESVYSFYKAGLDKVKEISGIDVATQSMPAIISQQYYLKDLTL